MIRLMLVFSCCVAFAGLRPAGSGHYVSLLDHALAREDILAVRAGAARGECLRWFSGVEEGTAALLLAYGVSPNAGLFGRGGARYRLYSEREVDGLDERKQLMNLAVAAGQRNISLVHNLLQHIKWNVFDYLCLRDSVVDGVNPWVIVGIILRDPMLSMSQRRKYERIRQMLNFIGRALMTSHDGGSHAYYEKNDMVLRFRRITSSDCFVAGEAFHPQKAEEERNIFSRKTFFALGLQNDQQVVDDFGGCALHRAVQEGNRDLVAFLCECGVNQQPRSVDGRTALMFAVMNNAIDCVDLLLKAGMQPDVTDHEGKTALSYAVQHHCLEGEKLLLAHGASMIGVPLWYIASHNQFALVRDALRRGISPESANREGWTALHFAANQSNIPMIRLLCTHGASNVSNDEGTTPLILAVSQGSDDGVRLICAHSTIIDKDDGSLKVQNIDMRSVRYNYQTALMLATRKGLVGVVRFLLHVGADPQVIDCYRCTALHFAASEGDAEMIALLCAHDAQGTPDSEEKYPLWYAVESNRLGCVRALLKALPCCINERNAQGETALMRAIIKDHSALVVCLLEAGADSNNATCTGMTPLMVACEKHNPGLVRLLLQYGARQEVCNKAGKKAVHIACAQLSVCDEGQEIVHILIKDHMRSNGELLFMFNALGKRYFVRWGLVIPGLEEVYDTQSLVYAAVTNNVQRVLELRAAHVRAHKYALSEAFIGAASAGNTEVVRALSAVADPDGLGYNCYGGWPRKSAIAQVLHMSTLPEYEGRKAQYAPILRMLAGMVALRMRILAPRNIPGPLPDDVVLHILHFEHPEYTPAFLQLVAEEHASGGPGDLSLAR